VSGHKVESLSNNAEIGLYRQALNSKTNLIIGEREQWPEKSVVCLDLGKGDLRLFAGRIALIFPSFFIKKKENKTFISRKHIAYKQIVI